MQVQHNIAHYNSMQLAEVIDNNDPEVRGRIRIKIHATQMECWAPVITPSAGTDYGVSFLPKLGELVVIAFISSDLPIVMGSLWSGQNSHTDKAQETEQRYSITTKAGSVVEMVDDDAGAKIEFKTAQGQSITITEESGGKVQINTGSESIEMSSSGTEIRSAASLKLTAAAQLTIDAPMVQVNAAMSKFSGVVQCSTLITNSVVSSSYTPGAGNIW